MRILTWNINSLRLRLPQLERIIGMARPDVICLQETKVIDALFPKDALHRLGFPYLHFSGMKGYNGVAILSKIPFKAIDDAPKWCGREDCRHIAVRFAELSHAITLHNFYVPAGGDVADPTLNPKFAHKLTFLEEVEKWFASEAPSQCILVGDLNIAPLVHDVWSDRQLRHTVSHTEIEITRLNAWRQTGFVDAIRHLRPEPEKVYTWWSYRNRDWKKSDRGRRLDHIWISRDLLTTLSSIDILKEVRDWSAPSDHVPVIADLLVL